MAHHFTKLEEEFEGYTLDVIGGDDLWFWCVHMGEEDLAEGEAKTAEAAMEAARAAARLRPQPSPCPFCGGE